MKVCENCPEPALKGMRYCKDCKKLVLHEMRQSGYLETRGFGLRRGESRTQDMREDVRETKHGTWNS